MDPMVDETVGLALGAEPADDPKEVLHRVGSINPLWKVQPEGRRMGGSGGRAGLLRWIRIRVCSEES